MLQKKGNAVVFYAFFVASKTGKTGLSPTVDVHENGTEIVTGAAATEVGDGLYKYQLAAGSVDANGEYTAVFKTTDSTVDQQHVAAMWVTPNWIDNLMQAGGGASVTVSGPVASGGDITIVRGDDYYNADGRSLDWSSAAWANLTGATAITFTVRTQAGAQPLQKAMTAPVGQTVRLELTKTETASLSPGALYQFDIQATLSNTHIVTLVRATVTVLADYTP